MRVVHYGGGIRTKLTRWIAGWPCCCSGERAEKIKKEGFMSWDRGEVTCKACLANMAKEREEK